MADDAKPGERSRGPARTPGDRTTPPTPPRWPATPRRWPTASRRPCRAGSSAASNGCCWPTAAGSGPRSRPRRRRPAAAARDDVGPQVRALLLTDIDAQRTSPLAVVRDAVRYPTEVLGGPACRRWCATSSPSASSPTTSTTSSPATFADLDPALHEPGLTWGAAKAHVHLARRRREGQR